MPSISRNCQAPYCVLTSHSESESRRTAKPCRSRNSAWVMQSSRLTPMTGQLSRANSVSRSHGLEIRELPFPADPVRYELVWHERAERSPALVWLRDELLRDARPAGLPSPT